MLVGEAMGQGLWVASRQRVNLTDSQQGGGSLVLSGNSCQGLEVGLASALPGSPAPLQPACRALSREPSRRPCRTSDLRTVS